MKRPNRKKRNIVAIVSSCVLLVSPTVYADTQPAADTGSTYPGIDTSIQKAISAIHAKQSKQQYRNTTDWTVLSLFASGVDGTASDWLNSAGLSGMDQLEKQIETGKTSVVSFSTTDYERILLGVLAGHKDPMSFAHRDWIRVIDDSFRPDGKIADTVDGSGTDLVNAQIWGVISLYAAGENLDADRQSKLVNWLNQDQHIDGGWSWSQQSATSDTDMTAMALIAYHALQVPNSDTHVQKAIQLLHARQDASGGFVDSEGELNTETTAAVIDGLLAQGVAPQSWKQGSQDPVQSLLKDQLADGSFAHQIGPDPSVTPTGNDMSTAQALIALSDLQHGNTVYERLRQASATHQGSWKEFADDVSPSSDAYEAIRRLQGMGVVNGYGDGTFRPNQAVTRAEFASMVVHALDQQDQIGPTTTQFRDVAVTSWYNSVVRVAFDNNLISGTSPGYFQPVRNVTGAEVMTMLDRAGKLSVSTGSVHGQPWYTGYVQTAASNGFLYPSFLPEVPATRAQCAVAIDHFYQWLTKR